MSNNSTATEIILKIESEADYIDIKPYSHNLVSIYLLTLKEKYGFTPKQVSNIVKLYNLDKKGWKHLLVE